MQQPTRWWLNRSLDVEKKESNGPLHIAGKGRMNCQIKLPKQTVIPAKAETKPPRGGHDHRP
ncbi:hypothetical protein EYF80_034188 [Liparis tanakae]|uniref:Uncharacterized protein n=1 Tax=Liparis tanakae TaxID=230148 RepID=A0A4Z2GQK9_9TELE|nr:hypothetical protein EYF80_034188 [Liparis tanakae]